MNHTSEPSQAPVSPGPERPEPGALGAEAVAQIEEALRAATSGGSARASARSHGQPDPDEVEAAHAAQGSRPRIRGPRVVQSGREHRTGTVVSVGPTDIFVEFGPKELGVVPRLQFKEEELPKVGGDLTVVVDRFESDENLLICSRPGAVQKADWEMLEPGQIIEARVTGVNKGGLELEVAGHTAFMPASQVDSRRVEDLSAFVGQKIRCKVTRVDRTGRGNITLSRRDIMAEERRAEFDRLKESLKEGDVREGKVRKIMPFGAFVDIGGIDGLLHISDLSHDRVAKVEDVLKEGDSVTVKILRLDWENKRHSLGLKQLKEDPWLAATKEVVDGAELQGRVTKLAEFGCFVEVATGVEGLCHISELSWKRVGRTSDAVQPGKVVKVKVLKVDPQSKRISLSIKQAMERPPEEPRGGKRRAGREEDNRKPEEILKETPALRRAREQARQKEKSEGGLKSGLGGSLGIGLGDLRL